MLRYLIGFTTASLVLAGCEGTQREFDSSVTAASPAGAPTSGSAPPNPAQTPDEAQALGTLDVPARPDSANAPEPGCAADGSGCLECEGESARCQGNQSRGCSNGKIIQESCGNACDPATGRCNGLRAAGSACDDLQQCQTGVCALDVTGIQRCCEADCAASGQVCGSDGSCACPIGSEAAAGACRRSTGQSCTQSSECATGICAGKVAGGSICCTQSCNGAFCAADGSGCVECDGAQSTCEGTTSARCEDGTFIRTACANGCNPMTGVCNGLLPTGQPCTTAGQCGSNSCNADLNGALRCCSPNCAATGRVCGIDGACACQNPGQIFTGGACGCAPGTKSCGDGRCIPNNQCCEACTGGRSCQGGNCNCPGGQQFLNGQCRLNLGAACTPNGTPCASGLCVDGVCCESACNGVCMQCQAGSGRCVMPIDDPGCPANISCPAPTAACQQSAPSNATINSNRCQNIGQCKTAANCAAPVAAPARTACGPGEVIESGGCGNGPCAVTPTCSVTGACEAPAVSCGGQTLSNVGLDNCCSIPFPDTFSTTRPGPTTEFCAAGASDSITAWCDGRNDCPTGTFCCLAYFGNFNTIACQASCQPTGDSISGVVCRSPGEPSSPCPQGTTCTSLDGTASDDLPGWSTCQ